MRLTRRMNITANSIFQLVILKIFGVFLKTAEIVEQGMPKRVCNGRVLNNVIADEHVQTFA